MTKSTTPPIEAVIFDIGGVLYRIEVASILKSIAQHTGKSPLELIALYHDPSMLDFEVGKLTDREFHAQFEALLGCPFPYPKFIDTWNAIFVDEIQETVALMHRLNARSDLKVGILSNTNVIHLTWMRQKSKLFDSIRYFYASNEIGLRKPNADAYHHVLKNMGVAPHRAVFIDDLAENIAAAKAIGMHGIHATDPASVHTGLSSLGIFCAENPASTRII